MHGSGACMAGGMHGRGVHAWQILRDTFNERALRILLECILVINKNPSIEIYLTWIEFFKASAFIFHDRATHKFTLGTSW